MNTVTRTLTYPMPTCTSITWNPSVLVDNSTDQSLAKSSSSPWAWIAMAILFILLTILFFAISIVLICIVRNMAMKLNKTKEKSAGNVDGE